jgi:uncharacterized membrane protein YeaQ/YmgE (transglycosylase-associated protein family)
MPQDLSSSIPYNALIRAFLTARARRKDFVVRFILGLLKGLVIGGGLGFAFTYLGPLANKGFMHYILYGLIGLLVGLVTGRPIWRKRDDGGSQVVAIIRGIFGAAICIGIYALVVFVFGNPVLPFASKVWPQIEPATQSPAISQLPYIIGGLSGILYGVFVEVDDGSSEKKKEQGG